MSYDLLYARYSFNEPWNGPNNRKLLPGMPSEYRCTSGTPGSYVTNYLAVVGPETAWGTGTEKPRKDVPANCRASTVMIVEDAGTPVNWMEPRDLPFDKARLGLSAGTNGVTSAHGPGVNVAFVDGTVEYFSTEWSQDAWESILNFNSKSLAELHCEHTYSAPKRHISDWVAPLVFAVTVAALLFRTRERKKDGTDDRHQL